MLNDQRLWQQSFLTEIPSSTPLLGMFDHLHDIVFTIKDRLGRYVLMSEAGVSRCRLPSKHHAIGLTAFDLFPAPMAERYAGQDARLFRSGRAIVDNLDLTLYRDRSSGWCITTKEPLYNNTGQIVGLACVSRDLDESSRSVPIDNDFAALIDYMHEHLEQPLRVAELAGSCKLSLAQLDRRMKKLFQLSSKQYLLKIRVDAAMRLLLDDHPISEIAHRTGFCDQSALSRQFRQLTGLSPRQYRQLLCR